MTTHTLKTIELSDCDISSYLNIYNKIFETEKSVGVFKNEYMNTPLGFSYHTFLYNDSNDICGGYTLVPFAYKANDLDIYVVVGTDLFIIEEHRTDVGNIIQLLNASVKHAKENGITACIGFPNDNSNNVSRAFLKEKRIGLLDTYILPYKVGDYKASFKILNPFSILFSKCLLGLSHLSSSTKQSCAIIKKARPQFHQTRFNWFNPEDYHKYNDSEMRCVWKVSAFEGIKASFLMDVHPLIKKNFDKAVRLMVEDKKSECGLFLYVGHLHFTPISMIKIPRKFEPKSFRFDCRILDKEKLSKEDVLNLDNWEVDLSSYDLL